jgi:hypothetical protein
MGETTFTIIVIVAAALILAALRLILGNEKSGILGNIKNAWGKQIKEGNVGYNDKEFKIGNYTVTI